MKSTLDQLLQQLDGIKSEGHRPIPPQSESFRLVDGLIHFLFPVIEDNPASAYEQYLQLRRQLIGLLTDLLQDKQAATKTADHFFEKLPDIYHLLQEDAAAFLQFDPAATCIEEVIATYPGFQAIVVHRLANLLQKLKVPLLPRVFSEYVHGKTGIDIHPAATIGHSFFIDHGTGVVIGATAIIGDNVKIYQGVTLGALQVDKSLADVKRHPTIEDNCILYANCTILGGKTTIGHDSVIGGNSWVTETVPAYSVILHQPSVKVRSKPFEEPVNFVI